MSVKHIGYEDEFTDTIERSDKPYILVDFYADWCGPCKRMAHVVDLLANKYPHMKYLKVNIEEIPSLAEDYEVSSIPLFLVFKAGDLDPIDQVIGASQEKLTSVITKYANQSGLM